MYDWEHDYIRREGMKPESYDKSFKRLKDEIIKLQKEMEYCVRNYTPCCTCKKIFHVESIKEGTCINCKK